MKTKGPRHDVEMWDRIVSDVRKYDIQHIIDIRLHTSISSNAHAAFTHEYIYYCLFLLFCLLVCMFCFNFQGCEMKGSTYHMFCIIAVCTNIATCLVETVLNNHTKRILGICQVYHTAISVVINYVRELYFLHMARCTHLFSELFSFNFLQTHLTIIL